MSNQEVFSPEQIMASNPSENIWVQANAGTGKTKVLVHRLLRILFRNGQYNKDVASGILCLTYTNAAAGEIRNRVLKELRQWAIADDKVLTELLQDVSENNNVTAKDLAYARKVFFSYIDNPDVLKIKTIHGFCEEILHRFPLEAGISPTWSLVSGSAQTVLLDKAFNRMIENSLKKTTDVSNTINAFYKIIETKSEYFLESLKEILLERYRSFFQVDDVKKYRDYFINTTQKILNLEKDIDTNIETDVLVNILNHAKQIENSLKKPTKYIQNIINITQQYIDKTVDFEK